MRKFFVLISCLAVSMLGVAVADDAHQEHTNHAHEHAEKCGHKKEGASGNRVGSVKNEVKPQGA